MREQLYDPFGDETIDATTRAPIANGLSYVGIGAFGWIVAVLVAARVFYFG